MKSKREEEEKKLKHPPLVWFVHASGKLERKGGSTELVLADLATGEVAMATPQFPCSISGREVL